MKKKKLIEILEQYDDDIEIYLSDWSEGYDSPLKNFSVSLKNRIRDTNTHKVIDFQRLELEQ